MDARGSEIRPLFEAHLKAYDLVLDVASQAVPVTEKFVRELHTLICEPQETYEVLTPQGWQEHVLGKGEYKSEPNHPWGEGGVRRAYAPVQATPAEMASFVEQLGGEEFRAAHPVLQASYAHYALVSVHPFADGNGRVARALASVFLYRGNRVPLVIFADQRPRYIEALESADRTEIQAFVNFVFERAIGTMDRVADILRVSRLPPPNESLARLHELSLAAEGLTHVEMDQLAVRLLELFESAFKDQIGTLTTPPGVAMSAGRIVGGHLDAPTPGYRRTVTPDPIRIILSATSQGPLDAAIRIEFEVLVAVAKRGYDNLRIHRMGDATGFNVAVSDLHPEPAQDFRERLAAYVGGYISEMLAQLFTQAQQSLKAKGYQ